MKPTLNLPDREAIQQIHQAALDLLLKEHEVIPLASEEEKALEELIARVDPEVRFDLRASCLGR